MVLARVGVTVLSLFVVLCVFFLMIRRPPRSTLDRSSAASDVYKRQGIGFVVVAEARPFVALPVVDALVQLAVQVAAHRA